MEEKDKKEMAREEEKKKRCILPVIYNSFAIRNKIQSTMAKIKEDIFSGFSGKLGNVVGCKGKTDITSVQDPKNTGMQKAKDKCGSEVNSCWPMNY